MIRTYMLAAGGPNEAGNREILRFTDEEDAELFAVVPDSAAVNVLAAIGRAYRDGRQDADTGDSWQERLDYLKACITGYDLLLASPQPGLHTWNEARARGQRRIAAACRALANADYGDRA